MQRFHIGTSGWSYEHWKDIFYPPKLKQADWLSFYAQTFDTTEINSSFYRMPKLETVEEWVRKVPKNFTFCPKMSRFLTHMKKLNQPEEPLERFFSVFEPMKKRMGPILVQLPAILKFNYNKAEVFYEEFKKYKGYELVMEVRHDTWMHDDSLTLMAKYNVGVVISQSGTSWPYSEMITAKNIYVRFHGPEELYASGYSDEMLIDFRDKFKKWSKQGHVVWAYFNNDVYGYAFKDAQRLKELLK